MKVKDFQSFQRTPQEGEFGSWRIWKFTRIPKKSDPLWKFGFEVWEFDSAPIKVREDECFGLVWKFESLKVPGEGQTRWKLKDLDVSGFESLGIP